MDDYNASIDMLVEEYKALKGLNPSHELLGLVELTSHGGFTMSPEFLRRYPPNPKFRKGGTTQAIHQMMAYHQTLEEEVTRRLREIIGEEKRKYGSDAELLGKPPEEREKINSGLEEVFNDRGLIGLVRTHITHNEIDLITV